MIIYLVYLIGFVLLTIGLIQPKKLTLLDNPDMYLQAIDNPSITAIWIGRIGSALYLLFVSVILIKGLYYRKGKVPKQGFYLTLAWVGTYVPPILAGLFSRNGIVFNYKILFFPLFLISVYLYPRFDINKSAYRLLFVPLSFVYMSLLATFLRPDKFIASYPESFLGIPFRIFGVTEHPNSLGAIALTSFILTELVKKDRQTRFWVIIHRFASLIVIIFSQSKTIWVTIIVFYTMGVIIKLSSLNKERLLQICYTVILVVLILTTVLFTFGQYPLYFSSGFWSTLFSRSVLWNMVFQIWLQNPIIGYGPNIWKNLFLMQYNYLWVGQAHNQIVNTLGESGIIGIISLLNFYLMLIKESKYISSTNFLIPGFLIMILVRSFTETPLRVYGIDVHFLINAIFYIVIINLPNKKEVKI